VDLLGVEDSDDEHMERWRRTRRIVTKERQPVPLDLVVSTPKELEERRERGDPRIERILGQGESLQAA
jgi:hypothetical protein